MASYEFTVYDWSPYSYFESSAGSVFVMNGDVTQTVDVVIHDNETGVDGLTLDDNVANSQETALADIYDPGGTALGVDVHADAGWTLYDPIDDVTFEVVLLAGQVGGTKYGYTLSEYPLVTGRTYEVIQFDNQPNAQNAGEPVFTYNDYVCFAAGSRIKTPNGWKPVEKLRPGDLVQTMDAGWQKLLWAGHKPINVDPKNPPIRLRAGFLGAKRDVVFSPLHRLLVGGPEVELLFGRSQVLAKAQDLLGLDGIEAVTNVQQVTYVHLLLDQHHLIKADGVWSESFHPGSEARKLLSPWDWTKLLHACPRLARGPDAYGPSARPSLKRHEAKLLTELREPTAKRHVAAAF